ncbi:hypothetical protein BD324DRAFT_38881 [Kockovaella imperatae]|uniref:UV excision repair protein RAD23 n=1 Tax=Kockovaella imperatae TaxID=4999 RepID=A0A1Y1UUG4_9TREE|nr:hypothetical protein BD324DRAFT_38881 [Kockovaella imperatae]ORX41106.1 hypothetical protein BD324DRAFT_38881 [Kockovaella imperatae]
MVKITFKTVQNKLFTVEAEGSETVADVKRKIQDTQSFPSEHQKLIYSGKILNDAATVGSLNIKEKDFIVVMVSKPKATPAVAAAASSSTPASAPPAAPAMSTETTSTPSAAPSSTENSASVTAAGSTATAPDASNAPESTQAVPASATTGSTSSGHGLDGGSFVTGPALQQAIEGMVEMGFPRDQVQKALRASFNNPDRAVEYLMSGEMPTGEDEGPASLPTAPIPAAPSTATPSAPIQPSTQAPAVAPTSDAPTSRAQGSAENLFAAAEAAMNRDRGVPTPAAGAGAAGAGRGGQSEAMAAFANSPILQQLRQMVRENPAMIQPLLQRLMSSSPQIAQYINQNPQALYDFLGIDAGDDGDGDDDMLGQQTTQINLTQEEAAAVERLEALGFDRAMVLQAYMACDKNEELAANFLFENGDEDQD